MDSSGDLMMVSTNLSMEPVEFPSSSDLTDAIQKGLGRALLWAKKGLWTDKANLLHACLHDLRYDRQCEEPRGAWLWQIMEAVGVTDEFRGDILDSLKAINDGLAGQQLCQFAVFYARNGDERFRLALQDIVVRKPDPTVPRFGEQELIELDGAPGFLFAARNHGASLSSREWEWDDKYFMDEALPRLGESFVITLLQRESQSSPEVKRLYDAWQKSMAGKTSAPRQSHADRMRQISLQEVIRVAEAERNKAGLLRGWGMYAGEADLRAVRNLLLESKDASVTVNYLRLFSNRPIPEFNERFLTFLEHEDENIRARALTALAQNTNPAIRKFALDHLGERVCEPGFLKLFIHNFLPGDENVLWRALRIPDDVDDCHWQLMDLRKILENNPESKCQDLAKMIYRLTPCGSCRHDTIKLLINRSLAPAWLVEESRYDAVEDSRSLATLAAKS